MAKAICARHDFVEYNLIRIYSGKDRVRSLSTEDIAASEPFNLRPLIEDDAVNDLEEY